MKFGLVMILQDLGMFRVAMKLCLNSFWAFFLCRKRSASTSWRTFWNVSLVGESNFLKTMIIGDECWVYGFDLETNAHLLQWKSSSSPWVKQDIKKSDEQNQSNVWPFLLPQSCKSWMHQKAKLLTEFIVKKYAVWSKRLELRESCNWQLHCDSVPVYSFLPLS